MTLTGKEKLLLKSLKEYYSNVKNLNQILKVVNGESRISLRLIDWFVTTFAEINKIRYNYEIYDGNNCLKIHDDYKNQLKGFSKKLFDPFCRTNGILFFYDKDTKSFQTTVCQLNFFRWVIDNSIMDYIEEYFNDIVKAMNTSQKEKDKEKKKTIIKVAHIKNKKIKFILNINNRS
jgi:hypothetical protein